jgi:integrase
VFTTSIGTIIEPTNLRRSFDAAITRAGVRRIRFHDLRHTCASLLLAEGVPMRVVMGILGHSTMAITSDIYSHVMPSALTNAAAAIDKAFTRADS